jgi:hypothetical protein
MVETVVNFIHGVIKIHSYGKRKEKCGLEKQTEKEGFVA